MTVCKAGKATVHQDSSEKCTAPKASMKTEEPQGTRIARGELWLVTMFLFSSCLSLFRQGWLNQELTGVLSGSGAHQILDPPHTEAGSQEEVSLVTPQGSRTRGPGGLLGLRKARQRQWDRPLAPGDARVAPQMPARGD